LEGAKAGAGPKCRTKVSDPSVGPKCRTQVSDPSVGPKCRTRVWDRRPRRSLPTFGQCMNIHPDLPRDLRSPPSESRQSCRSCLPPSSSPSRRSLPGHLCGTGALAGRFLENGTQIGRWTSNLDRIHRIDGIGVRDGAEQVHRSVCSPRSSVCGVSQKPGGCSLRLLYVRYLRRTCTDDPKLISRPSSMPVAAR